MDRIQTVIEKFKLKVSCISSVPESYSSEVYKLKLTNGSNVYVKIPFNKDKLFREYRILQQLNGVISVPRVLDFWEGSEQITGALLLSEIRGAPCSGEINEQIAYQIGVNHAMLHKVSTPSYGAEVVDGFKPYEANDWRGYIKGNFEKLKGSCKEVLNEKFYELCIIHFDEAFSALPRSDGPCMVHMDFRPGNILIDNNEVTGIIDFESARGGSSEIDFTKIDRYVWKTNPQSKTWYIEGYTSIRPILDLNSVLPFYDFYDAFSGVAWCKRRGIENNKSFLNENISILEKSIGRLN
jgi:aminoglycoside phosphotransferase (APT) family kinase protein